MALSLPRLTSGRTTTRSKRPTRRVPVTPQPPASVRETYWSVKKARWVIAAGLTIAVLMDALNGTIFTFARPYIMGDTATVPDEANWFNLGYLMAKVACLPAAAWFVDRVGESRSFFLSACIIALTSVLCALPVPLAALVSARILQGAAGAVLLVAAQTILFRLFPKTQQGLVQSVYALGVVMSPVSLAPALQGWLTNDASWAWVFWVNLILLPLSCLLIAPFASHIPTHLRVRRPFDLMGFGLFTLGTSSLVYVLLEGARWNWFDHAHITLWALVGATSLLATLLWRVIGQNRSEMFARQTFSHEHFAFGFFVSFFAGFVLFGSAFLIPAFALNVLSMPPVDAGLLLLPSGLAVGGGLLLAGTLITVRNVNPARFVPLGIGFVVVAMWMLSGSNLHSGPHDMWDGLLLRGLGLGFLFMAITMITLGDVRPDHVASAVGLFNFGRQMGGIIGIGFLNGYLNDQIAANRRILIENINASSQPFQTHQTILAETLVARGLDPGIATNAAAAVIQNAILGQVAALSFNEAFLSLALLFIVAAPIILSFKILQRLLRARSALVSPSCASGDPDAQKPDALTIARASLLLGHQDRLQ